MRKTVLIVKSALEEFRIPFYKRLMNVLEGDNVGLQVLLPADAIRKHTLALDGTPSGLFISVNSLRLCLGQRQFKYQSVGRRADTANLVIVQQSSSDLTNYLLFARRRWKRYKLAFWGHGQNFQESSRCTTGDRLRHYLSKRVDYWFAYNDTSAEVVKRLPFPIERICVVNNSIDTERAHADWNSITSNESAKLRQSLGIREGEPVVVYCGSLYRAKMLGFLLESAALARRKHPLHLIVIGDGPAKDTLREFEKKNAEWVHYVGPRYAREKAMYFRLACLSLLPGAVGLGIVDSMAYEAPLLTTRSHDHGPEIGYLEPGENGWVTDSSIADYAAAMAWLLEDSHTRLRLIHGCRKSASRITMSNMVERFRDGVNRALEMAPFCMESRARSGHTTTG